GRMERQPIHQRLAPATVLHVEQQRSRSIADFRGEFSSEPVADIVFGKQHLPYPLVIPGLVLAQPQDLGRRKAGQGRIGYQFDQLGTTAGTRFDLGTLGTRSLVVPENRRSDDLPAAVEKDAAVHLSRKADPGYVSRFDFARLE